KAIDNTGNERQSQETWTIKVDTTPPFIVYTFPEDGAKVSVFVSSVVFIFSEQMDSSVDVRFAIGSSLYPLNNSTITWKNNNTVLVLHHPVPLNFATTYQLILNPSDGQKLFKDIAGNELKTTVLSFVTEIQPKPQISVSVSSITFAAIYKSVNPQGKSFVLSNTGDDNSQLNWTATIIYQTGNAWLTVSPSSGSLSKNEQQIVVANVNIAGMSPGTYTAEIEIVDINAKNSPQKVYVSLEILLPYEKFSVEVQVKDEKGAFLRDVKIKLLGEEVELVAYTGVNGSCEFKNLDGYKKYILIPQKTNYEFSPSSVVVYLDRNLVVKDFVGRYILGDTPQKIDIPLSSGDTPVMIDMPKPGDVKIVVEERVDKPQKLRGSVNPDKGEEVGIVFKPDKKPQEYIGQRFTIKVFTVNGELVEEFYKIPQTADETWVKWAPKDLASGVYIIYVEGPGVKTHKKVVILR
ncbi:MAG: Ig-like domain-containing protein, partial [Endomicrobia bacterium]|nr:Ig-like domain-containing protein [Endomicrobiia bacterium]